MKTLLSSMVTSIAMVSTALAAKTPEEHVQAVRQIGQVLAEYTQKKGTAPFSEKWKEDDPGDDSAPVTILCHLSKNKIPDQLAYPPFSCYLMAPKQLEEYLAKALGRKITLPRDDRDLKLNGKPAPLFNTIQIDDGKFFVATYLTEPHKDARKLGENWYKFEVGSVAVPGKKIEKAIPPAK
ncbi:MAG: hypothetical protein EOP83_07850 [Verrucomicrobiaceae bacterium]|nr:MAG: hypothetical protein EOP83_07850 [Verrucomicrobiaceae bacterium]